MNNTNIVTVKLSPPPPLESWVCRTNILKKLEEQEYHKVSLISAPAGYGKTTLASQWFYDLKRNGNAVCWQLLDKYDSNPARFISHFIAAIRTIESEFGSEIQSIPSSIETYKLQEITARLLYELERAQYKIVLFLDDFYLTSSDPFDKFIEWFLQCLPANLHLVLISRDCELRVLPLLRLYDKLLEINVDDLRFDEDETNKYITVTKGINISLSDIKIIYDRSEGWITSLQRISQLLHNDRQRENIKDLFSGTLREISDYFLSEVFDKQTDDIQEFLLCTATLTRMNGEVCDYILQQKNSSKILRDLESRNLFVISMDENREWYRYHRLFHEFLLEQLHITYPDKIKHFNFRAAKWFEKANYLNEAITYALRAENENRIDRIMELGSLDSLAMYGNDAPYTEWAERIPGNIKSKNQRFLVADCFLFAHKNQPAMARQILKQLQNKKLSRETNPVHNSAANKNIGKINEEIHMLSMKIAYMEDDVDTIEKMSRKPVDLCDNFSRGFIYRMQGYANMSYGRLKKAKESLMSSLVCQKNADAHQSVAITTAFLSFTYMLECRHGEALKLLEDIELLSLDIKYANIYPLATVRVMKAAILYDMNRLEDARKLLEENLEYLNYNGHVFIPAVGYIALVRCYAALGDYNSANAALERLHDIARNIVSDQITAFIEYIRASVNSGEILNENALVHDSAVLVRNSNDFSKSHWKFEYCVKRLATCRLLFALGETDKALSLVELLEQQTALTGVYRSELECLIFKARLCYESGQYNKAMASLARALEVSRRGDCFRPFIDEGESIKSIIDMFLDGRHCQSISSQHQARLVQSEFLMLNRSINKTQVSTNGNASLMSFTPREFDVVNLLATGKPNYLIADSLSISENTVKFHMKNIYQKLKVKNRAAAIAEASKQGLLM